MRRTSATRGQPESAVEKPVPERDVAEVEHDPEGPGERDGDERMRFAPRPEPDRKLGHCTVTGAGHRQRRRSQSAT